MHFFSDEYKRNIAQSWRTFVQEGKDIIQHEETVRKIVYDSWVRSRGYNVDPNHIATKTISEQKLNQILKDKEKLISIAKPYMESLYSFIKGLNFIVSLTDENGYIIHMIGDDDLIKKRTCDSHLRLGSARSERYAGTNSMGTCLYLGKPLQLYGEEHYISPNHLFTCAAAPIHDDNNKIIGCLNFTGPREQANYITLSVVVSAANGIEKGMSIRSANEQLSIVNKQLSTMIQSISSGILLLDDSSTITQFNNQAAHLLKTTPDQLKNNCLSHLISSDDNPFVDLGINTSNKEVDLTTRSGHHINLSMSTTTIYDDSDKKLGIIVILDALKNLHKLTNKFSGFTAKYTFDSIIGDSGPIHDMKQMGRIASKSDASVLILGESGTGKELIAQAIHNGSSRAAGSFIAINCGSLPRGLIESELFGYEKGAFTGASRDGQPGKFELADGGTVFLDEIGDMPLDLQASLLRVLQTKEIVRIGGNRSKQMDVRIIAATNINLENAIKNNTFRRDLYYRLNVFSIELPPLRNHREDIPLLSNHFMTVYSAKRTAAIESISPGALDIMCKYSWPGNIRELENTIERATNLCKDNIIDIADLPQNFIDETLHAPVPPSTSAPPSAPASTPQKLQFSPAETIQDAEYDLIVDTIAKTYGNMKKAAELLGISRRALYYKIRKYEINQEEYR